MVAVSNVTFLSAALIVVLLGGFVAARVISSRYLRRLDEERRLLDELSTD